MESINYLFDRDGNWVGVEIKTILTAKEAKERGWEVKSH